MRCCRPIVVTLWTLGFGPAWAQSAPVPPGAEALPLGATAEPLPPDEVVPPGDAAPGDALPEGPGEVVPEPVPPPAPPLPPSYVGGFWWVDAGPRTVADLTDVALHPQSDEVWAAAARDGSVWVTYDGGRTWLEVLAALGPSLSSDEEVLVEIEARISEVSGTSDFDPEGYVSDEMLQDLEDAAQDAAEAARSAVDEIQSELEAGAWFLEQQAVQQGALDHAYPRVWFTTDGLLVVGRADGLRVSVDLGATFSSVLGEPITGFAELPGGPFVVGTPDGVWTSATLSRWTRAEAFDDVRILDLVEDGGLYAATTDGLWFTSDLTVWRRLRARVDTTLTARPVVGAPPEDRSPRAVVLAAADDLWRANNPVEDPANPVFGGPIPRSLSIVRRDDQMMLAASAAGPFQSVDRGITWVPVGRGLEELDCRDVEVRGELVLLAGLAGLHRLVPVPPELEEAPVQLPEWIALGTLIEATTGRDELRQRLGPRAGAALLPDLTLEGDYRTEDAISWDAVPGGTTADLGGYWAVSVRLQWQPNRQRTSGDAFDGDNDLSVIFREGNVQIDDGSNPLVLYSAVTRGVTVYRSELVETVSQLYLARQRLVQEQTVIRGDNLLQQVERALRLAEIEARLDALTDGTVSSWDAGTLTGGQ